VTKCTGVERGLPCCLPKDHYGSCMPDYEEEAKRDAVMEAERATREATENGETWKQYTARMASMYLRLPPTRDP
jgi:hypothetical protein